jgi:hypothetical protein
MAQPFRKVGTGRHRVPPWPGAAAGGTGLGVSLSIWVGPAARESARAGMPSGGPVTVASVLRTRGGRRRAW